MPYRGTEGIAETYFSQVMANEIESNVSMNRAIAAILYQEIISDQKEEAARVEANNRDDLSIWHYFMQWLDTFSGKDFVVLISLYPL